MTLSRMSVRARLLVCLGFLALLAGAAYLLRIPIGNALPAIYGDARSPWKMPVRAAAASNVDIAAPTTVDGLTPAQDDSFLLFGQNTASENGIWGYDAVLTGGTLLRRKDMPSGLTAGDTVLVTAGTYAGDLFVASSTTAIAVQSQSALGNVTIANTGTSAAVAITGSSITTTTAQQTVVLAAGAYTGRPHGVSVDLSGATSISNATDVCGATLTGETNAGAGNSVGVCLGAGWDRGLTLLDGQEIVFDTAGTKTMSNAGGTLEINPGVSADGSTDVFIAADTRLDSLLVGSAAGFGTPFEHTWSIQAIADDVITYTWVVPRYGKATSATYLVPNVANTSAGGTYTLAITCGGQNLLDAATKDLELVAADTVTTYTLTATDADRVLSADEVCEAVVTSNHADLVNDAGDRATLSIEYR